jgi:hypothetical protein
VRISLALASRHATRADVTSAWTTFASLPTIERLAVVAGGLAVLASFALRIRTLAEPLVEAHAFRQTQTAYTAVIYHREGINLLQTPLPVLGPPWVVPFEFPLFEAIAALVMNAGVPTEIALRSTSLFFFVISAALVWGIVRLEVGSRTAVLATVAFVLAPIGLLWSRTSMVETTAMAAVLATVYEALRWDRGGSRRHLVLAIALGALSALLKVTTAAIWLAPAVFLLRRSRAAAMAIVAAAAVAGLAWTGYTDAIKAASPATAWLTSGALRDWNFGTVAQHLDPRTWGTILFRWLPALGIVVFLSPFAVRGSRLGIWALTTLILGPLIFINLYFVHDYYWMAVAPAGAILIGLVVDRALRIKSTTWRRVSVLALGALFAASFVVYPRWILMLRPGRAVDILTRAAVIRDATKPDDLVAIDYGGGGWSPELLFYADRRGYMEDARVPPAPPGYTHFTCHPGARGTCVKD